MKIQQAIDKLFSLHRFGIKLGLDSTIKLLEQIGNPHKELKSFHVAGSNGKGSTASFIASILMEAGYKVGLYTSPHFRIYNERIRINGKMIEDEYVAAFVESLEEYIEKNNPTFFEITTALAFKYFADQKVDYAVIETGLGGRLDATNVIQPLASVITSISLEHTEHLGNTIEKIAAEKAGIIKPDSLVFTGKIPQQVEEVFESTALRSGSKYIPLEEYTKIETESVIVSQKKKSFSIYTTPLLGSHQLLNSALAVKVVDECLDIKSGLIYSTGINNVVRNTGIEGRYEIISYMPKVIFDSAHNTEGIHSFISEFSKECNSFSERILIFGVMRDKSINEMLLALDDNFDCIYVTQVDIERSATIEELVDIASSAGVKVRPLEDPFSFLKEFLREPNDRCLVVLGSMYLLGEIKSKMFKENA